MNENMKDFFRMEDLFGRSTSVKKTVSEYKGPRRKASPKPSMRLGPTCESCGLKRSVNGSCFCD